MKRESIMDQNIMKTMYKKSAQTSVGIQPAQVKQQFSFKDQTSLK